MLSNSLFLNFSNVLFDIPVEEFGTDSSISTTLELNSFLNFNAHLLKNKAFGNFHKLLKNQN